MISRILYKIICFISRIVWFQKDRIYFLLITQRNSLILLNPASLFNLITWFLLLVKSFLFKVSKSSSIGANWGLYGGKNMTLKPQEFIYSNDLFDTCIGELSRSSKILCGLDSSSSFNHLIRSSKYFKYIFSSVILNLVIKMSISSICYCTKKRYWSFKIDVSAKLGWPFIDQEKLHFVLFENKVHQC